MQALNRETTGFAIAHLMEELRAGLQRPAGGRAVPRRCRTRHQGECRRFSGAGSSAGGRRRRSPGRLSAISRIRRFRRYQVNVIVDNGGQHGAPVIYEDNPTHQTLVGRVEHLARFGALVTDFNLLTPGALHRANGGYLVLDAQKLLTGNFGWASLKRALEAGQIRIETLEQLLSMASTVSLRRSRSRSTSRSCWSGRRRSITCSAPTTRNSPTCSRSPPISRIGSSARRRRRCSTRG